MLPPYYFYWFRIDNKHMTEPWLDQALMNSAYRSGEMGTKKSVIKYWVKKWQNQKNQLKAKKMDVLAENNDSFLALDQPIFTI